MSRNKDNSGPVGPVLSAAIVAYLALQVYVGFAQVESWPFTHGPMFANAPADDRPATRYRFEGVDASRQAIEIAAESFNRMKRSQIRAWIRKLVSAREGRDPERFCRGMIDAYKAAGDAEGRLVGLRIFVQEVVASGTGADLILDERMIQECELTGGGDVRAVTAIDRAIILEAESFTEIVAGSGRAAESSWQTTTAHPGSAAGAAVEATPNRGVGSGEEISGPRLDYRIDFDEPGTYHVWVRMLGRTTGDDSIHLGLDREVATLGNAGMTDRSAEWHWEGRVAGRQADPWVTVRVEQPGAHVLNVWMREDGVVIDQILLTRDARLRPEGIVPASAGTARPARRQDGR